MAEGWRELRLSELGALDRGHGITKADLVDVGVPCLRYGEIYSTYDDTTEDLSSFVSDDSSFEATPLHHGDIVFAASGETREEIGKAIAWLGHGRAVVGGDTIILRGHGQDPTYLAHALNADSVVRQKCRLGKGQSVVHIHVTDLAKVTIHLPPLRQQRKVARMLRTWDEKIRKLQALQKAETRRRRGLIVALATGKRRILKFEGRPWATMPLSRVLAEGRAKSAGGEEIYSVSVNKGLVNQVEHLGRSYAAANTSNYNRVMPGDIVYTRSPTGDFPLGIVKQSRVPMAVIVSPLYGVFTPATQALGTLLDAWFESPIAVRNYLRPLAQKGAKNTISVTNRRFLEGKLHLPLAKPEQKAMAATIEESRAVISTLESQIRAYRRQRRGLGQRLLVGRNGPGACCRGRESP